jgi:hypothetical protein
VKPNKSTVAKLLEIGIRWGVFGALIFYFYLETQRLIRVQRGRKERGEKRGRDTIASLSPSGIAQHRRSRIVLFFSLAIIYLFCSDKYRNLNPKGTKHTERGRREGKRDAIGSIS